MKRKLLPAVIIAAMMITAAKPAEAQQRYIVRNHRWPKFGPKPMLSANCQVQGSLDGPVGQTYLVTSTGKHIAGIDRRRGKPARSPARNSEH